MAAAGCGGGDGGGGTGTGGSSSGAGGAGGRIVNSGTGGSSSGTGGSSSGTGGSSSGAGGSSTGAGGSGGGALTTYKTCTDDKKVGGFTLTYDTDHDPQGSGITGYVMDGVESNRRSKTLATIDGCTIKQPTEVTAVCAKPCAFEEECTPMGMCVKKPVAKDLGKVTVTGLKKPLELVPIAFVYSNPSTPELDHPPFADGANVTFSASGAGGYGPFNLKGLGIKKLEAPKAAIPVEAGKPAVLTWTPAPESAMATRMAVKFSVNQHGTVDTWLECEVPDTGTFTLSAQLTTELFKYGVSGFPSVDLSRRTSDTATVPSGCVDFVIEAPINRSLQVPGIVSCSDDSACQAPKTCQADLVCR